MCVCVCAFPTVTPDLVVLQDLPNNMIHQVAIKTLPQEWLFCETWCSDEQLETAKTIDLVSITATSASYIYTANRV